MREIMFFCAVMGIAALFAPQLLSQFAAQTTTADTRRVEKTETHRETNRVRSSVRGTVEIPVARNGHFVVDADVNLSPVRFVVDTGASFVALRQSDAEIAGIYLNQSDFNVPVSTANGTAYAARVQLDSVEIDGIDIDRVNAVVLPDGLLGISLLGNSFLNRLHRFQVSDNRLVMEN